MAIFFDFVPGESGDPTILNAMNRNTSEQRCFVTRVPHRTFMYWVAS